MKKYKKLQDLTIKDNFMFCAVMSDETNCKELLELVLGVPIEKVTVSKEMTFVYHPDYKSVRLDVVARDEAHTHYDIEMQVVARPALEKRCRYYHSHIDMELLETGLEYEQLPNAYVIFICNYDPFGEGLYRYSCDTVCRESSQVNFQDGRHTIILSTKGKNDDEVPIELVKFLKYVGSSLEESLADFQDAFVNRLQASVEKVKRSREMEDKYMLLWKEILRDERMEGREEGREEGMIQKSIEFILDMLGDFQQEIPAYIVQNITEIRDDNTLKMYFNHARKARSLEEFEQLIKQ